ncbi:hypothetical protein P7L64_21920 [Tistrella bauzanensis]|uniref:hypothetical protein n=1 Tax=Tistrella bauzanensis TaxID=657419 RepID=UPI0016660329|nr:hypothetical protein [Tistrella bauzanensis]
MTDFPYRRINILGASGSGTTTLGRAHAARLGLGFVASRHCRILRFDGDQDVERGIDHIIALAHRSV